MYLVLVGQSVNIPDISSDDNLRSPGSDFDDFSLEERGGRSWGTDDDCSRGRRSRRPGGAGGTQGAGAGAAVLHLSALLITDRLRS